MAGSRRGTRSITINRAPVLTLWASVVAERLGYAHDEALTLGQAVAGMNAAAKARSLGLARPREKPAVEKKAKAPRPGETVEILLCNRLVPAVQTRDGLRAMSKDKPAVPTSVQRYLEGKFGEALEDARAAMAALARSLSKEELDASAFSLYESFRPAIPPGVRGWGAKGVLDLARIRALATRRSGRG